MEHDISTVESLSNRNRQAFPELQVMYIVSPTENSLQKIAADFEKKDKPKYGAAHLFFLSRVSDDIMQLLDQYPLLVGRLQTLQEINIAFQAPEAEVFHLGLPHSLHALYGPGQNPSALVQVIAQRLVTLCVSLNECPHIRYNRDSPIGALLADEFHRQIMQAKRTLGAEFWFHGSQAHQSRDRGVLLLLDRGQDLLAPFLHDFTYQANVYDVLGLEGDTVQFQAETGEGVQQRTAILGENDEIWTELRHQHIASAVNKVREQVDDFVKNNAGAKAQGLEAGSMTMADVSEAMKAVPEYREVIGRLTKHLNITQQCMDQFQQQGLIEVIELEQSLATGVDELNQKVSKQKATRLVMDYISRPEVRSEIKARILGVYFLTQVPVSEQEKNELYSVARLDHNHQSALDNLVLLGANTDTPKAKVKKSLMSRVKGAFKKTKASNIYGEQQEFTTTRHRIQADELIEKMAANTLSLDQYPSKEEMAVGSSPGNDGVSVRKASNQSKFSQGLRAQRRVFGGARQIVFFIGGCTYTEMRVAYEQSLASQKEVIIGGTSIFSPPQFLADLEDASIGELGTSLECLRL